MGRGRNRKPRNFATFRLCPRPGAADASDRVDSNPYSVPGFADDGDGPSSSTTLPEHVRREMLELGLPDDGYDYLPHLRELRPSLSSTGGGASVALLPSRRRARFGLPSDVKAYDASRVRVGSGKFAEAVASSVRCVEEAIDLDVAKLLEESDVPAAGPEDEGLEEDFVIVANQPEKELDEHIEEEEKGKERVPRLLDEQFDLLALEKNIGGQDGSGVSVTKGL